MKNKSIEQHNERKREKEITAEQRQPIAPNIMLPILEPNKYKYASFED